MKAKSDSLGSRNEGPPPRLYFDQCFDCTEDGGKGADFPPNPAPKKDRTLDHKSIFLKIGFTFLHIINLLCSFSLQLSVC